MRGDRFAITDRMWVAAICSGSDGPDHGASRRQQAVRRSGGVPVRKPDAARSKVRFQVAHVFAARASPPHFCGGLVFVLSPPWVAVLGGRVSRW